MTIEGHLDHWDISPTLTREKLNEEIDMLLRPEKMSKTEYKLRRKIESIKKAILKKRPTS